MRYVSLPDAYHSKDGRFRQRSGLPGSIDLNKVADLVILESDPLSDIRNTRTIHAVIFDGKVHQREELQAIIRGVEEYVTRLTVQVALWDAVIEGDVPGALAAIKGGADVNGLDSRREQAGPNGRRPLNYAAWRNDTTMIDALLAAGAGIAPAGLRDPQHAVEAWQSSARSD